MPEPIRILYIDDDQHDRTLVRDALEQAEMAIELTEAATKQEFLERLVESHYDLILTDFNIRGYDALQVIDALREHDIQTPIIVVTGTGSEEAAVEIMKKGVADYVIKTPDHIRRLPLTINSVLEQALREEERRMVDAAVKDRERLFRAMYDQAAVGIVHATLEGKYLQVNPFFCRMVGRSVEDLLKMRVSDITHPDDVDRSVDLLQSLTRGENTSYSLDKRFSRPDGSVVWATVTGTLVHNSEGEPLFVVGIAKDITERRRAQEQVKFQAKLLGTVGDAVIATDNMGIVTYLNSAAEDLYGWTAEDALGKDIMDVTVPETSTTQAEDIMGALRKGERWSGEFVVHSKDGAEFFAHVTNTPVYSDAGEQIGVIGVSSDVSERKRFERALQESEENLRQILEATTDGIWKWDVKSNETDVSDRWFTMLGYEPRALAITNGAWLDQIHPDDRDAAVQVSNEFLESQDDRYENEFRMRAASGAYRWIYSTARVVERDDDGKPVLIIGNHSDITERKQAEENLRKSEARFRRLYDSVQAGVVLQRADGSIAHANSVATEIFGMRDVDITAKDSHDPEWQMVLEDGTPVAGEEHPSMITLRTGEALRNQVRGLFAGSPERTRWISINTEPIRDNVGAVAEVLATFHDVTERKRIEEALREREAMLSRLAGQLQRVREDERVAIARELHDELGAGLTGLKMDLDWIVAKAADVNRELFEHAQAAAKLTESSMELVHRICQRLRPPVLDILGLPSAISWYVGEFEKETGIACHATVDELGLDLESDAAVAVFRILQESLTNVVRHSRADRVEVELERSKDLVQLSVTDNGVGISKDRVERPDALGLLGMQERAAVFGGEVALKPGRDGGTEVLLKMPVGEAAK